MNVEELQRFIRFPQTGQYLLMADGEVIDTRAAREHYRIISSTIRWPDGAPRDWTPVGVDIHWEGETLTCAHSERSIEPVYRSEK